MKKIFSLLSLSVLLISCSKGYVIRGTVDGVPNGTRVILERQQQSLGFLVAVDSAKVQDGHFTFEGKAAEPALYQIAIDSVRGKSLVIVEEGDISIKVNKENVALNKVSGTYNNDELTAFGSKTAAIQQKVMDFQKANNIVMKEARAKKDTATINRLFRENRALKNDINKELLALQEDYTDKHPKSFISVILIQSAMSYPDADIAKVRARFDNLDSSLKKTIVGKNVAKKLEELKSINIGRKAPDFSAPDTNGKNVALSESLGAVTIIDFWASWCPPCRKENPNMVALYKEFHDKGLNIIGVSLDKDAAKWKEAIAKDGLVWTQISNLKYWDDPIAQKYGVESIPATFVLNQYGVVVAKDLNGETLRQKVAKLLDKKKQPMMPFPMGGKALESKK